LRLIGSLFTGSYNEAVERLQGMWNYPGPARQRVRKANHSDPP